MTSSKSSKSSSKSKIEDFTLHMALERLRAFYAVLKLGLILLSCGVLLTVLAEILWRVLPPGRLVEWVISALSVLSWMLTSLTVAIASTCPIDELELSSFIDTRPRLCFFLAVPPALTAATRLAELPIPRILSLITVVGLLARGFKAHYRTCPLPIPNSVFLLELWCLDVILSSSVNHLARAEPHPGISETVLAVHGVLGTAAMIYLWAISAKSTVRFYVATHLACSWSGCYFGARAFDLVMGYKQWEEGRQVDIAIAAAVGMAGATLLPLFAVLIVGRKRLFKALGDKFEQSRSRQLQSGAFMAMLLDSYFVQTGQPWWIHRSIINTTGSVDANRDRQKPFQSSSFESHVSGSMESLATPPALMPEVDERDRPDFVKGHVVTVSRDGHVFWVQTPHESACLKVDQKQQVIPWPELLELGRKNLRCIDWKVQYAELWSQNAGPGFQLSRPVGRGEVIDFFVSHSWGDSGQRKFRALSFLAEEFHVRHGRYPTFWVDKFCIDQTRVEDGLRVLPVNVMACSKVLVLCGQTYPTRLWCAWELCVLLSFMSLQTALTRLVVFPFSETALQKLARFDLSISRCYDPNEELRLRRVISAIGKISFENKIQALGQLILDRETNVAPGLLMQGGSGSWASESDHSEFRDDHQPLPPDLAVLVEISEGDISSSLRESPAERSILRNLDDYEQQLQAPLEEVVF